MYIRVFVYVHTYTICVCVCKRFVQIKKYIYTDPNANIFR